MFAVASFFMVKFMLESDASIYLKIATVVVCGLMCLSYLMVALSNPGIVTKDNFV
jgi:hypothetical protein